ncbi:lumazine synthase [Friedmanniomyces endolithicus]|uniref:6,7-dimethyl-8-ribityllumazine synthase n=1 Tax=Friedmanniomyces endolithicus TaxID=329885 RepID=A0AAN6J5D5_9PEZI|nr:lumazine synthase [Friedmanniomyces endolithicus]KAK0275647.1 lumazine synthase [Friedmanniomyces endolithicus]KAK0316166.1 lumazine synthase [Friedmanniomyces endolithicus]KAK0992564.1 lumazine synthase [Friedmanniomyces endolithicus]
MAGIKGLGEAHTYDGSPLRIAIIHARWNTTLTSALLAGVLKSLTAAGVKRENIVVQSVPGSYELPYAVQRMYTASQTQAAAASILGGGGGLGRGLVENATDLLGGSVTDLAGLGREVVGAGAPTPTPQTTEKEEKKKEGEGGAKGLTQPFDALIAIGALIKGSTMHFEYISDAVSHGLMRVQLDTGCPVIFGLLTLLTEEQGRERAGIAGEGGDQGHNHGEDWGAAAVELGVKRRGWAEGRFVE